MISIGPPPSAIIVGMRRQASTQLVLALGTIGLVTLVYTRWWEVSNAATVSTTFLLVVLVVATTCSLPVAIATSIVAMLTFNFFFLPPLGTFTIADPQNWVALTAFLAVSLVASHLSSVARARTAEAVVRRDELARLFDLSRDVMVMTDSPKALETLARSILRRFDLEFVAIALPEGEGWRLSEAGVPSIAVDTREIASAFAAAQVTLEFDARSRTYAGHRTVSVGGRLIRLVPLRVGAKPVGVLATTGRPVEVGTLDALAGVVAIAIERTQLLGERKAAELTRQSEELKTALLASLGHDLRTPLTAIRLAANNLKGEWLSPEERREQGDLVLGEVERLSRLFQNVLEMARIDAGAVSAEARWTHPSEIIAAARDQVAEALRAHTIRVEIKDDVPVRLDPRITATALAHLLENAAQYSPKGSSIKVVARLGVEGLELTIADSGPGIAAADLPRLFERFYRGTAGTARASGTGLGLWIARGLLASENGRLWAENRPEGGAQFTIAVPAAMQSAAVSSS
jgi:two-component system sensor histidine kinase KdpD